MPKTYEKCETCGYVYPPGSKLSVLEHCSIACRRAGGSPAPKTKSTKKKKDNDGE